MRKVFISIMVLFSCSAMASYLNVHGSFERMGSAVSAGDVAENLTWNAVGGGVGIGFEVMKPVSIEGYFDYLKHLAPYAGLTSMELDATIKTMHFGGKVVFLLADILVIKAGAGICNTRTTVSSSGYYSLTGSSMNPEIVVSGGVLVPISPAISLDIEGLYRRILSTEAVNSYGGQVGVTIGF